MSTARPRYEQFDHTSEAGVIARGSTLAEAYANMAEGMYALVLEIEDVQASDERDIVVEAEGHEALLIDWLLELVFLTETEGLVFRRFEVDELSEARLRARVWGELFDEGRHRSHHAMVKAVTKHMLEIGRENGGYRVQVLFDV